MTIDKGVWEWSGFPGAPGYSIFYATPNALVSADINAFFASINIYLPDTVTIKGPATGDQLDEATGLLTGTWTGGSGASTTGTVVGDYAAPCGASVTWETSGIANGRRVRGRTFIVPLAGTAYDADGTLKAGPLNAIQSAASGLVTAAAGDLLVWHRPVGGVGGSAHPVVSARVSDRVAVLRSRRD